MCYFDVNTARIIEEGHPKVKALDIGWPKLELNSGAFEDFNKRIPDPPPSSERNSSNSIVLAARSLFATSSR